MPEPNPLPYVPHTEKSFLESLSLEAMLPVLLLIKKNVTLMPCESL